MKKYNALKIKQPFGEYYVISMSAFDLLSISFSDPLRYDETGELRGNQRKIREDRIREISEYIKGTDVAFPNSIIISSNYMEDGTLCDDINLRWTIEQDGDLYFVIIPTTNKLASIIDGQHRLNGFRNVSEERQKEIQLLVCIYFDLPNPLQAYIFATINYNQKPVDKSLALEQWGFSLQTDDSKSWSPEMLAVFLSKKLNTEKESPFYRRIVVAPLNDDYLFKEESNSDLDKWEVSTSSIVDSIVKLISKNPKTDLNKLRQLEIKQRKREFLDNYSGTPLRSYYLSYNDLLIYKIIENYLIAVTKELFSIKTEKTTYIKRTVGIQALFIVLKEILNSELEEKKDISVEYFSDKMKTISMIDFTDNFFTASGIGKTRIKNTILLKLNYLSIEDISNQHDINEYLRFIK